MMYMWDIEGETSSGICLPTESSFSSALIIGCAVPSVRADVASALNSRVLEIASRINPAATGARKIISKPREDLNRVTSPGCYGKAVTPQESKVPAVLLSDPNCRNR